MDAEEPSKIKKTLLFNIFEAHHPVSSGRARLKCQHFAGHFLFCFKGQRCFIRVDCVLNIDYYNYTFGIRGG